MLVKENRRTDDTRLDSLVRDSQVIHGRLSSMETVLSGVQVAVQDVAKAMVTVARVEERLAAAHEHQQRVEAHLTGEISALKEHMQVMAETHEETVTNTATSDERIRWLERFFWVAVTAYMAYRFFWVAVTAYMAYRTGAIHL